MLGVVRTDPQLVGDNLAYTKVAFSGSESIGMRISWSVYYAEVIVRGSMVALFIVAALDSHTVTGIFILVVPEG